MCGTESIIHVDVTKGGQTLSEFLNLALVSLHLLALFILVFTFFFGVET